MKPGKKSWTCERERSPNPTPGRVSKKEESDSHWTARRGGGLKGAIPENARRKGVFERPRKFLKGMKVWRP